MNKENEYQILKDKIKYSNDKYYKENKSIISDYEYDDLYKRFKELASELKKPDFIPYSELNEYSNTLRKIKHEITIRSLKSEYSKEKLLEFQDFIVRKITKDKNINWRDFNYKDKSFILQPKIDGLSVIFYYKKGIFNKAATRGDFFIGEDITYNIQHMQGFPKKLTKKIDLILRGELYCPLSVFKEINENRKRGVAIYKHPRNFASGSARLLDTKEFLKRDLKLFFYDHLASFDILFENDTSFYEFLKTEGFNCFPIKYIKKIKDLKDLNIETFNFYQKAYEKIDAPTDGLVIKINGYDLRQKIGFTNQIILWAIAYKFKSEKVITKLKDISFSVSRYGDLTPVALLEPVYISGSLVKRANLFNFTQVSKKNIKPGDFVEVEKSGEIIPNIIGVLKKNREVLSEPFKLPEYCPSCGNLLVISGNFKRFCIHESTCYSQIIQRFKHFVSKDAMGIADFSIESIKVFVNEGFIKNLYDIYKLDFDILIKKLKGKGFGVKSLKALEKNIQESKKKPWENLLYAIGIRGLGASTIDLLKEKYNGFYEIMGVRGNKSHDICLKVKKCEFLVKCFKSIKGIGKLQEQEIISFFEKIENRNMIYEFKKLGLNIEKKDNYSIIENIYTNKSFCITGSIKGISRRDICNYLKRFGILIHKDIKKDTNYLIVPSHENLKNSNKLEKAKKLGIEIISYEDLNEKLKLLK